MMVCQWLGLAMLIFGGVLVFVSFGLSPKGEGSREKNSPFECGFDPHGGARAPFSLRFFLLGVVFLIFDVEIVLLFPLTVSDGDFMNSWGVLSVVFMMGLLGGTLHEWREGSLD
uniref:NADH-ubiquinone oxidoreductase chain 3 n=1 Tax=Sphaeroma terebrans TaxID=180402 RepID=A0A5J6NHN8_SPHTE|nr:NADH dehydrogenase subunit 3 [Sphaeroma terebrans]